MSDQPEVMERERLLVEIERVNADLEGTVIG